MAIVVCDDCGEFIDDDWNPCEEHPESGELICPSCAEAYEEEHGEVEDWN